ATDVGDGKYPATFQQGQTSMGEPGVHARSVSAITIEIERRNAVQCGRAAYQADGYPGAIRRSRPFPAYLVILRVEGTFHRGLLEYSLGAAGQLQCAYLRRAIQRLVTQPDLRTGVLLATLHVQAVYR